MENKREYNFLFGSKMIKVIERNLNCNGINVSYIFIKDISNYANNKIQRVIKGKDNFGNIYSYSNDNSNVACITIKQDAYKHRIDYVVLCKNKLFGRAIVREYLERTDFSNMINYEALGLLTDEEIENRNKLLKNNFALIHSKKALTDTCISRAC